MKQICPEILEKIVSLYYAPEYFFNHIFRDLFSSTLSSEYLYRVWDYIIYNFAIEHQQIYNIFFLCAVLLTILARMQKKVKMIIDIVDFAHVFQMETSLIGNTKVFHSEIQEILKKIKLFFSQDKSLINQIDGQIKPMTFQQLNQLNFNLMDPEHKQDKSGANPFKFKQVELSADNDFEHHIHDIPVQPKTLPDQDDKI